MNPRYAVIGLILSLAGCLSEHEGDCRGNAVRNPETGLCECPPDRMQDGKVCVGLVEETDDSAVEAQSDSDTENPEKRDAESPDSHADGDAGASTGNAMFDAAVEAGSAEGGALDAGAVLDNSDGESADASQSEDTGIDTGADAEPDAGSATPGSIRQVVAGGAHTCALGTFGAVKCWGANESGQLGDGTKMVRSGPVAVTGVSDAVELAAGRSHTCARLSSGAVTCWGANNGGQLGDGTTSSRGEPMAVTGLTDAKILSAGGDRTCVITKRDTIACWGAGQSTEPTAVSFPTGNFTDIAASGAFACVLYSINVSCWGASGTPGLMPSGHTAQGVELAVGSEHTCLRASDRSVQCWGSSSSGQLGAATFDDRSSVERVSGLTDATAIDAGDYHTCALRASGAVACWGNNIDGQLGNGSNTTANAPALVAELSMPSSITAGGNHSCALLASGVIKCWGANQAGQLGDGSHDSSNTAVAVVGLSF